MNSFQCLSVSIADKGRGGSKHPNILQRSFKDISSEEGRFPVLGLADGVEMKALLQN